MSVQRTVVACLVRHRRGGIGAAEIILSCSSVFCVFKYFEESRGRGGGRGPRDEIITRRGAEFSSCRCTLRSYVVATPTYFQSP